MVTKDLYLVIDQENKAVLCFTKSLSCANSVSLGFINSQAIMFPSSLAWRSKELEGLDLKTDHLMLNNGNMTILPEHLVTKKFLENKEVAKLRALYINSLEVYLKIQLVRVNIFNDENVVTHIHREVNASDPAAGSYSAGVLEYANISEITPESAYNELTLMLDSIGLIKLRNMAWYNKYVSIINTLHTREEMKQAFRKIYNDIYTKALI